jgi:hypothetical protein
VGWYWRVQISSSRLEYGLFSNFLGWGGGGGGGLGESEIYSFLIKFSWGSGYGAML